MTTNASTSLEAVCEPFRSARCADGARGAARARGFTIVELLIAILVIGTLIGILLVSIRAARTFTGSVVDDSVVEGVAKGVEAFRSDHGFVPPLVQEWLRPGSGNGVNQYDRTQVNWSDAARVRGPGGEIRVALRSNEDDELKLRTLTNEPSATEALTWDNRFSEVSLSYYLAGALPLPFSTTTGDLPIDGIDGLGMFQPTRTGRFEVPSTMRRTNRATRVRAGQVYGPYIDLERASLTLQAGVNPTTNAPLDVQGRAQLVVDRGGVALRYYQWINGRLLNGRYVVEEVDDLRVPPVIGRKTVSIAGSTVVPPASQDIEQNAELRTGPDVLNWAVVGAGPNKVFGDEDADFIARQLSKPLPTTDLERAAIRNEAAADNAVRIGRVE
jgi:prepilin-type N-terminal cleavage/methylation domain-containing protein